MFGWMSSVNVAGRGATGTVSRVEGIWSDFEIENSSQKVKANWGKVKASLLSTNEIDHFEHSQWTG